MKKISLFCLLILLTSFQTCSGYKTKDVKPKGKYIIAVVVFYEDFRHTIRPVPKHIETNIVKFFKQKNIKAYVYPFNSYRHLLSGNQTSKSKLNFIIPKVKGNTDYICMVEIEIDQITEKYNQYVGVIRGRVGFNNNKANQFYQSGKFTKTVYEKREKKAFSKAFSVINREILKEIEKYIDKEFVSK